ncbi:MAG: DUF4652 domain-containing protein [Bacteroidales bacterium]
MKSLFYTLFIICSFVPGVLAQQNDSLNFTKKFYHSNDSTLYYYKVNKHKDFDLENFVVINNNKYIIATDKKTNRCYIVFKNEIIDTLINIKATKAYAGKNDSFYLKGYGKKNNKSYNVFYKIDAKTGEKAKVFINDSINFTHKYENYIVGQRINGSEETYNDFFIYNLKDHSLKKVSLFTDKTEYPPIYNFTFLDKQELFIWTAHAYGNWFDADKFYKYNIQTGEITSLNEKIKQHYVELLSEKQEKDFKLSHLDYFDTGFFEYVENSIILTNRINVNHPHIALDKNGTFTEHIGDMGLGDVLGFSFQNNKYDIIYFKSQNENGEILIIPLKYTSFYAKALAKVKEDKKLIKKEINELKEINLLILKNFVFAKYNYAFNSNFYQAYFNLLPIYQYETYQDEKTKNVNSLLTETDKYNLKLIKEEIERREE